MKLPKGIVTSVAMLTMLLAAGFITLPSSILTSVSSAAKAQSDDAGAADVDIQILASKPRRAVKLAVLSSPNFDATSVDPASVTLAGFSAIRKQGGGFKVSVKDVNKDDRLDMILEFPADVLNIGAGPTKFSLEGLTYAGTGIRGGGCLQPSGEPCGGTIIPVNGSDTEGGGRRKKGISPQSISFSENFDSVTPPALPLGWSAITTTDCANSNPWGTSNAGTPAPPADTLPNAAFVNDPNCISDERLHSPQIPIVGSAATLTFRQNRNMENNFDGGVLEVSTDGGANFADILAAGGTFAVGGYNGTISVNFGSPIGGRQAWTGNSAGFVTTTVNFPASFAGDTVILRFRRATDSSVSGQGWRVDTISIDDVANPCQITCPANVTQANDPDQCGAVVNYPGPTTTGDCGTVTCSPTSGSFFPVGTTQVTCTASAGPTCSFTVTVNDAQPPSITCPANVTQANDPGQCGAAVNFPLPTASDNCPGVTASCSPTSGSFFPVGTTQVTCTATDASGNMASCNFTVTVNDTEAPVISGASASPSVLWPPNHKMVNVTVSYTSTDNCGTSTCTLSVSSNEPVNGTGDGDKAPDWIIVNSNLVQLRAERAGGGTGRIYTITITCTDAAGNSSSTTVTVTVPHNQ
ncbi:MAG TPA: HYR domain-containing protein [Blastocatellia bacterium]|nr:HYR domain-containing protein [Blastocatellia bacterium]